MVKMPVLHGRGAVKLWLTGRREQAQFDPGEAETGLGALMDRALDARVLDARWAWD